MHHLRTALVALLVCWASSAAAVTFTVDTTADDADDNPGDGICHTAGGDCSLPAAQTEANATTNATIAFGLTGGGPYTFSVTLLDFTANGTTVDGTTQSGSSCGDLWSGSLPSLQIIITSSLTSSGDDFTWKGLEISGVPGPGGAGLGVTGDNTVIQCNVIHGGGSNVHGIETGIGMGSSTNATIGGTAAGEGNYIYSNGGAGIYLFGSGHNLFGNFVGTDGTNDLGNTQAGIRVDTTASSITIGSNATTRAKNLVSGNDDGGIIIDSSTSITVAYNWVGLDRFEAETLCQTPDIGGGGSATETANEECATGCCVISGATGDCVTFLTGIGLLGVTGGLCADPDHGGSTQNAVTCAAVPGIVGGFPDCTGQPIAVDHFSGGQTCDDGCPTLTPTPAPTATPGTRNRLRLM